MNFPKVLTWKKRRRPLKLHCRLVPWQLKKSVENWGSVCLEDHPIVVPVDVSGSNHPIHKPWTCHLEGEHCPILRGLTITMVINHLLTEMIIKWNPFLSGIKQCKPMVNLRDLLKNSALFGSVSWNDPSAMPNVNTWGKLQHSSFLGFWWFNDLKIIRQAKNISGGGGISFEKKSGSHRVL